KVPKNAGDDMPCRGGCSNGFTLHIASCNRRLEQLDRALTRIESCADAERQSPLRVDVAEREPKGDRNAERRKILLQQLIESEGAALGAPLEIGEPADCDPSQAGERPHGAEVSEHAVHAIEALIHVLEE